MKVAWLCAFAVACSVGCRTPASAQLATRWSQIEVYRLGSVSVPPGWNVLITPGPRFDLHAPDADLAAYVVIVYATEDAPPEREAVVRLVRGIGAPPSILLSEQPDGALYGSADVDPDWVFAACAVPTDPRAVTVAVVRLVNKRSVRKAAYERAGGQSLLCRIAASVTLTERRHVYE